MALWGTSDVPALELEIIREIMAIDIKTAVKSTKEHPKIAAASILKKSFILQGNKFIFYTKVIIKWELYRFVDKKVA